MNKKYRIGIDTGGTFVDAVEFSEETRKFKLAKSPTTPSDATLGFLNAIRKLGTPLDETYMILHGTTLGVNAIIERRGVKTGIIANEGFGDVFEIGRGNVPANHIYDYNYLKPERLVKRRNVRGVPCRVDFEGKVLQELDEPALKEAARSLVQDSKVSSLAISFLHSYRNPEHEQRAAKLIAQAYPQVSVSISSDVVREYREYERTSTTVIDAYIKPIVSNYLERLDSSLRSRGFEGDLLIMRSDGGVMNASTAGTSPISTVQSGPAGGVVGAKYISGLIGRNKIITMDIGGTSLDVCVIEDGETNVVHQTEVDDYPLLLTMYDIRSIGAGGGSNGKVVQGILEVGPESSGADPGPMCYGRGGRRPTVTDAAIVLGYIDPETFLSGDMPLQPSLSYEGIKEQIAEPLGVGPIEASAGIMKVTIANSMSAIRQITVEEGRDPADFSLLSFGGAGPLFASALARELQIPEAIVPSAPAAFSAWGMLMSDVSHELSMTHFEILDGITAQRLKELFAPLVEGLKKMLEKENAPFKEIKFKKRLELRYLGQEHTLEVELDDSKDFEGKSVRSGFDELHLRKFGHNMDYLVEIVNLRVRGIGILDKPDLHRIERKKDETISSIKKSVKKRDAYCLLTEKMTPFSIIDRSELWPGVEVGGPAIIDEGVTRTVLHTGQSLTLDEFGNIVMRC